jgi:phytanoyl-CoA hydroxylase
MLTLKQKKFWNENGYLILPAFLAPSAIDKVIQLQQTLWQQCPSNVVVDDLHTNRRCYMSSISDEEKEHHFKINDLYLNYLEVLELSLERNLVEVLEELLLDKPVLCNTLSLDYGTQQFLHVDSLYMTPRSYYQLAASWIAFEDCHAEAGPLVYVPGSHKIPIYRFSNGSPHQIDSEFHLWQQYIESKVTEYGLKEETFLPKKGDVFIWHAQLLHGGSSINNPHLTRKSLVSHYFTQSDCIKLGSKIVEFGGGYWMDRPTQKVVENEQTTEKFKEKSIDALPQVVVENDQTNHESKLKEKNYIYIKIEHILRTTLHYFRLWKQNVLNFPK